MSFETSLETFLFWTVGLLTCLCAIAVAVTQNIVRAAVWLLFTLGGVAALFFLMGADFVGAAQLLIYVGGILILVVFGVMLTAQGPFTSIKTGAGEWAVALVVGLLLYGLIGVSIFLTEWRFNPRTPPDTPRDEVREIATGRPRRDVANDVGLALLGVEAATPEAELTIQPPAQGPNAKARMRTRVSYLLPFEIVSVHLLVVLVGAAYLARAKRRKGVRPA